jgi:phosphatidylinositol-3-phosphatase
VDGGSLERMTIRPARSRRLFPFGLTLVLVLAACGPSGQIIDPPARGARAETAPADPAEHIAVIVMENKEYGSVIGSSHAPYLNRLARRKVLLRREYATSHPSLPNYLALIGGSTFGTTSDCTDCYVRGRNLVDQLEAHGISWSAYMQSMPSACYTGASSGTDPNAYAKKHDPFMYFNDIRNRPSRCNKVVPFTELRADLRGGLPQFVWITPNECADMHSCSVATGDAWLKRWVPRILPALGSNGIVLILFDEGSSDRGCCGVDPGGGHVAALIAGPGAAERTRIRAAVDHYSVLRLIEDEWGLRRLRGAGDEATTTIQGWRAAA